MDKRNFIKTLSLGALSTPIYTSALSNLLASFPDINTGELSTNEDFWKKIRQDYRLKPDYINLESGYYNIIPKPTLNAMIDHARMVNYEGSYYMRTVQWENKKRMTGKLAEVAGCSPSNVVITRNTTESLDMVIKGMDWKAGDEAIMAIQDYGAMRDMFKQVARRFGIVNKVISIPNHPESDDEIVSLYENAITPNTKLLMVCHMINITGQILPIRKICDMAHAKGVKVMVDGAHCIGHFKFKIEDLNCDFYGSSLHKWLAVPLGTGLLYVNDNNIDSIWPIFAESNREPGDISRLNHTGTHPVYHDLSIENAIDYFNMLGVERKEARLRYLQQYWTSAVRDHPKIIVNTPDDENRACGIANVGIAHIKPDDLAKRLLEDYKIFTVAIDHENVQGCRITPNVFTLTRELDVFIGALKELAAS
ncbi:MAG: aminotransferase class V-fold PLP-dependent enzyme [Flavobacteriaceae bacterium]|nr:aminotransferase class V-fold PLP-dependent enzyme [Bacteroidia bacterium]NNF75640.1 aminotransferase class V-fold PLP-dependent enzyme [Flavobacteriaceae bacterium]NNK71628.1 aminotransferase class V-fold PLP-dependent enzyme [Flavobacteriaceae bacterium]